MSSVVDEVVEGVEPSLDVVSVMAGVKPAVLLSLDVGTSGVRAALFLGLQAWWILTPAPGVRSGPRIVEIPAHRGFFEVARQLDDAGVIRSPLGFLLLTIARGSMRSLKAGETQFEGDHQCTGYVGDGPCQRILRYVATATYK